MMLPSLASIEEQLSSYTRVNFRLGGDLHSSWQLRYSAANLDMLLTLQQLAIQTSSSNLGG